MTQGCEIRHLDGCGILPEIFLAADPNPPEEGEFPGKVGGTPLREIGKNGSKEWLWLAEFQILTELEDFP